jgi:tetratricopeptide (TPR) repeat protein
MRRFAILLGLVSLLLPVNAYAQPKTPEAAVNLFNNALRKTGNGDLDGAIEDYTRAITLSSRLHPGKKSGVPAGNSFSSGGETSEEITLIDPFTANAYGNRGLARYQKGDYAGAIEDFTAALKIRPALATAYLNRAAARRATGDFKTALKDLDRAISINKDFFEACPRR